MEVVVDRNSRVSTSRCSCEKAVESNAKWYFVCAKINFKPTNISRFRNGAVNAVAYLSWCLVDC